MSAADSSTAAGTDAGTAAPTASTAADAGRRSRSRSATRPPQPQRQPKPHANSWTYESAEVLAPLFGEVERVVARANARSDKWRRRALEAEKEFEDAGEALADTEDKLDRTLGRLKQAFDQIKNLEEACFGY